MPTKSKRVRVGSIHTHFTASTHISSTPCLRRQQRRYVDRGVIPRALSLIFAEFKERSDQQFTCHISYLEIYNEQVCVPAVSRLCGDSRMFLAEIGNRDKGRDSFVVNDAYR